MLESKVVADKTLAAFPLSTFEYKVLLADPIFAAFDTPTKIAESIFRAFREWNVAFENITFRTFSSSANDLQVGCDFGDKRVSFVIQVQSCTLTVTNPNWSEAELIKTLMRQGIFAMGESTKGVPRRQSAVLAMHVGGLGLTRADRLAKFRPSIDFPMKSDGGFGFCLYGENCSWLIDLSGIYGDALFVRIDRAFDASIPIDEVAASLYKDELKILDLLDLSLV